MVCFVPGAKSKPNADSWLRSKGSFGPGRSRATEDSSRGLRMTEFICDSLASRDLRMTEFTCDSPTSRGLRMTEFIYDSPTSRGLRMTELIYDSPTSRGLRMTEFWGEREGNQNSGGFDLRREQLAWAIGLASCFQLKARGAS